MHIQTLPQCVSAYLNVHVNGNTSTNGYFSTIPMKIVTSASSHESLLLSYLSNGVAHILVDSIGHLCSLHTATKLHVQHTRVVSEPPVISFVTCQPCAVDTGLLTCTDTDYLSDTDRRKRYRKTCGSFRLLSPPLTCLFSPVRL